MAVAIPEQEQAVPERLISEADLTIPVWMPTSYIPFDQLPFDASQTGRLTQNLENFDASTGRPLAGSDLEAVAVWTRPSRFDPTTGQYNAKGFKELGITTHDIVAAAQEAAIDGVAVDGLAGDLIEDPGQPIVRYSPEALGLAQRYKETRVDLKNLHWLGGLAMGGTDFTAKRIDLTFLNSAYGNANKALRKPRAVAALDRLEQLALERRLEASLAAETLAGKYPDQSSAKPNLAIQAARLGINIEGLNQTAIATRVDRARADLRGILYSTERVPLFNPYLDESDPDQPTGGQTPGFRMHGADLIDPAVRADLSRYLTYLEASVYRTDFAVPRTIGQVPAVRRDMLHNQPTPKQLRPPRIVRLGNLDDSWTTSGEPLFEPRQGSRPHGTVGGRHPVIDAPATAKAAKRRALAIRTMRTEAAKALQAEAESMEDCGAGAYEARAETSASHEQANTAARNTDGAIVKIIKGGLSRVVSRRAARTQHSPSTGTLAAEPAETAPTLERAAGWFGTYTANTQAGTMEEPRGMGSPQAAQQLTHGLAGVSPHSHTGPSSAA